MNIITFSEGLQKQIKELADSTTNLEPLARASQMVHHVQELVADLQQFTYNYTFTGPDEEIRFFKEVKPVILSHYYYYKKLFDITLFDSYKEPKNRLQFYESVLIRMEQYCKKNYEFFVYCMGGHTYLDDHYFTRKTSVFSTSIDKRFSTGYDDKLAQFLAQELIKGFVQDAIARIESNRSGKQRSVLEWTESKISLIEMIYALQSLGAVNFGKADTKQLVTAFEEMFAIDLGNYARVFSELRLRKSGQTNFIDHLKEKLVEYINKLQ